MLAAPRAEHVDVAIYDLDGRRVRALYTGVVANGERRFAWNGADDVGRPARPGVYFARMRRNECTAITTRILRVR